MSSLGRIHASNGNLHVNGLHLRVSTTRNDESPTTDSPEKTNERNLNVAFIPLTFAFLVKKRLKKWIEFLRYFGNDKRRRQRADGEANDRKLPLHSRAASAL